MHMWHTRTVLSPWGGVRRWNREAASRLPSAVTSRPFAFSVRPASWLLVGRPTPAAGPCSSSDHESPRRALTVTMVDQERRALTDEAGEALQSR